ncbi:MAG: hypothetical protein EON88_32925 [Brevundimonas sp.]|nr:MAG: hypothetical protein EON88_32925 [Brevundimonas sp.]
MSAAEMKRRALLGMVGALLMASILYAAALFGMTPFLILPLGFGAWLFQMSRRSTAIRLEMHARTKACGLRSYPAPNWVYGVGVIALMMLIATPLFGRPVLDRLGLAPVPTLVVSWGVLVLLAGGGVAMLMKEISLVYAQVSALDAGDAVT